MFLNRGRGGLIFKYAFDLFISFTSRFLRKFFLAWRGVLSRTEDILFSHRTHRFNRTFPPAFRVYEELAPPPTPPPQGGA